MINIREVLGELGIEFKEHGENEHTTQNFIQIDCPVCDRGSKRFHCGIHEHFGYVRCWQCGEVGSLYQVLVEAADAPRGKIAALLKDVEFERLKPIEHKGKLEIPGGVKRMTRRHREYLRSRGLDPQEMEDIWGLKGIGIHHRGTVEG
jgi:hypothetical protein